MRPLLGDPAPADAARGKAARYRATSSEAARLQLMEWRYGWTTGETSNSLLHYSNRTRGYRKQHGLLANAEAAEPVPDTDDRAPLEVRRSWFRLIRKVYEGDPLVCPHCGRAMKIIGIIERPAVIRQILEHLGLPTAAPGFRAPPNPLDGLPADPPREWAYEPLFADLPVPDPVFVQSGPTGRSVPPGIPLPQHLDDRA